MTFYNMMTGEGFPSGFLGPFTFAWAGLIIIVFITLILRRQCSDGILTGTNYNTIGGFALGIGIYLVLISILGDARWALLGGLAGIGIGGFVIGMLLGSEVDDSGESSGGEY